MIADVAEATRDDVDAAVAPRAQARSMPESGRRWRHRAARRSSTRSRSSSASARRSSRCSKCATTAKTIVDCERRARRDRRLLRILCRRGDEELRRDDAAAASDVSREHRARTGRRGRRDRAVEFSAAAGVVESRAGTGGRMHDRSQAGAGRRRSRRSSSGRSRSKPGVPEGVLNVVTGSTRETRRVDGRASRRSTRSRSPDRRRRERLVAAAAAQTLKRVTLELGGKSPSVVFDDADIDAAVAGALYGIYLQRRSDVRSALAHPAASGDLRSSS